MPATRTATESDSTATISILHATKHPTGSPLVEHVTTAGHRVQAEPRTSPSTPLDRPTQTCPKFLLRASSISIPSGAPSTTVPSHPVLSTTLPEPLGRLFECVHQQRPPNASRRTSLGGTAPRPILRKGRARAFPKLELKTLSKARPHAGCHALLRPGWTTRTSPPAPTPLPLPAPMPTWRPVLLASCGQNSTEYSVKNLPFHQRNVRVDRREKPCTFAALEGRGCGEIGRHARLRIWCFGVGVRVPPPAHLRGN